MFYYSNAILAFAAPVLASIVTFIGTIIVAFISIYNNHKTSKENKKLIERNDLIEKSKVVERKLNEFYIPLRHYLSQSKSLFRIFNKNKPKEFRTLTYLLDPMAEYGDEKIKVILTDNDKVLLSNIIDIGCKIENLINEKIYLIGSDQEFVNKYVPSGGYKHIQYDNELSLIDLLISHLLTIRLAFRNEINGEVDKFKGFVFPNEINTKINNKISELEEILLNYELKINTLTGEK